MQFFTGGSHNPLVVALRPPGWEPLSYGDRRLFISVEHIYQTETSKKKKNCDTISVEAYLDLHPVRIIYSL